MKCEKCGATFDSNLEYCPYCNTLNRRGVQWKMEESKANADYEQVKSNGVWLANETFVKILNIIIKTAIILTVLYFAGFCLIALCKYGFISLNNKIKSSEHEKEITEYYENGEYGMMFEKLSDYNMFTADYYDYCQISLLSYDYEDFVEERMEFMSMESSSKYIENEIEMLVNSIKDILQEDKKGKYSEYSGKNLEVLNEYKNDVCIFAKYVLNMSDEDLEHLSDTNNYYKYDDEIVDRIVAGKAWEKQ